MKKLQYWQKDWLADKAPNLPYNCFVCPITSLRFGAQQLIMNKTNERVGKNLFVSSFVEAFVVVKEWREP